MCVPATLVRLSERFGACESFPKSPPSNGCPKVGAKYPGTALLQLIVFGICGRYASLKRPVMLKPILVGSTAEGFANAMGFRKDASAKTTSLVSVGEKMWVTLAL